MDIITHGLGSFVSKTEFVLFGLTVAAVVTPLVGADLHYTIPGQKLEYTIPGQKFDYTIPGQRLEYTVPD